jgi:hypothetical protein
VKCQAPAIPRKGKSKKSASKKKGADALDFRPSPSGATDWLKRLDGNRLHIIPTAKVTEIMDTIRRWKAENPKQKVTIFTQFNHFAIILGVLLKKERMQFVYLTVCY